MIKGNSGISGASGISGILGISGSLGISNGGGAVAATKSLILMPIGQSNATRRDSQVTLSYPSNLKSFTRYGQHSDRLDGSTVTNPIPNSYFLPTVAYSEFGENKEGIAPGFVLANNDYDNVITFTPAIGARHFRELMKGTGSWSSMLWGIYNAVNELDGASDNLDIVAILDQGESDADSVPPGGGGSEGPITEQQYIDVLTEWTEYFFHDVPLAALNKQTSTYFIGNQICITNGEGWRNVQNACVDAAQNVTNYYLAGPRYVFPYETDGVHITGEGKRLWAEYIRHRYEDIKSGTALPVFITSATRAGAVITLTYNTISGDLVIDTTNVPETTTRFSDSLYGFEVFDTGVAAAISTITVSGNQATITLSADPGNAVEVRYAQMTWPGGLQDVTGSNSALARGNIRDSGTRTAQYDSSTLYNWACHQSITTST